MLAIHHVSVVTADLDKSLPFYREVFGLRQIERPNFPVPGAWLISDNLQIHLVANPEGSFRTNPLTDRNDWHFAFRTDDFEAVIAHLHGLGFSEDLPEADPKHLLILRAGMAGFPQVYLRDPDLNIVEINGAS